MNKLLDQIDLEIYLKAKEISSISHEICRAESAIESLVKLKTTNQYQQVTTMYRSWLNNETSKLKCPVCKRTFGNEQGFLNHCRMAHALEFSSHEEAISLCSNDSLNTLPLMHRQYEPLPFNSESSRFHSRKVMRLGNVSTFINDLEFTHKWMIYVCSAQYSDPADKFITKVRFHLDKSFVPNIIDVDSAPFKLERKGWGEFLVKVELFFIDEEKNKPWDHNFLLKLDKDRTGLEVLGYEFNFEIELDKSSDFDKRSLTLCPKIMEHKELESEKPEDLNYCAVCGKICSTCEIPVLEPKTLETIMYTPGKSQYSLPWTSVSIGFFDQDLSYACEKIVQQLKLKSFEPLFSFKRRRTEYGIEFSAKEHVCGLLAIFLKQFMHHLVKNSLKSETIVPYHVYSATCGSFDFLRK